MTRELPPHRRAWAESRERTATSRRKYATLTDPAPRDVNGFRAAPRATQPLARVMHATIHHKRTQGGETA